MLPLKLTLTGFRGIQAGMGLDTFTLDLSEHAGAQLVAIVAPNGRGKTTVLDNLQPYRLMPSKIRGANYSPDAFSYFDHLVSPGDALKELLWEHQGTQYRTLIEWKIREKTQSTTAYLQRRNDAGTWEPVTLPDGTSSDGKAKTYDRCVEGILGSPRLYFTAAFSAQGRSQLSSYGQGDIKSLMSEVLGLHRIQELGEKAGAVVKGLRARLADRRERLQELDGIQEQAEGLRASITENTRQLNDVHLSAIERHRQTVAQEQIAVTEMRRDQQDAEELRTRRQAVQQQITDATTEHTRAIGVIDTDIATTREQHQQAIQRLNGEVQRLSGARDRAIERKAAAEQLLGQREAIEAAERRLPDLRAAVQSSESAVTAAQEQVSEARQARAALTQLDQHLASLADAGRTARAKEEDLKNRCALTKEVPCQGTDMQGQCRLLTDAVDAEQRLPLVSEEIAQRQTEYREASARRTELSAQAEMLPKLEGDLQSAQGAQTTARATLRDAEELAGRAAGLTGAEATLADAEQALADTDRALDDQHQQRADADQQHSGRVSELDARRQQAVESHQGALARLQAELDRIPVPGDDSALLAAQRRLADAEQAEQQARGDADRARGAIATAEGRLSALEESIVAGESLAAEVGHLDAEITHWAALQKALGRDGILALSIDDAGPTLAALTNDLLMSCYGPRFSVRIDTQETVKSTGVQKETFDVIVFDSESDSSKSVSEMSGGERIWINEALTRAIALYQAQQTGATFHTLFSDESDGALDPEKKGQFVRMKRRVLELGGYEREFFISHSPDVWPLADSVIHLGDEEAEAVAA